MNRSRPGSPDKVTARKRDDVDIVTRSYCTNLYRRVHQATLSRFLADRNVVTTLDVELACDALDPIAFDGHRSVKIDRRFMCTAFWNFCSVSRFCAAHHDTRRILLTAPDCCRTLEYSERVDCHIGSRNASSNFLLPCVTAAGPPRPFCIVTLNRRFGHSLFSLPLLQSLKVQCQGINTPQPFLWVFRASSIIFLAV